MTSRLVDLSLLSPWGRASAFRGSDAAVAAIVGVYAVAAVAGVGAWPVAASLDNILYGLIGVATIAQTARVAWRSDSRRARVAWHCLTLALLMRIVSGFAWGTWKGTGPDASDPLWLTALGPLYLAATLPALLIFPSARWRARDAWRARIDSATVLLGSGLGVWFLGIGPMLRSPLLATAPLDDRLFAFGNGIAVVLVAGLFLHSATTDVRRAAGWLLVAYALRFTPDLLIWQGTTAPDFSEFGPIDAAWFTVWVFQWAAARAADAMSEDREPTLLVRRRYESGVLPHLFLGATVAMLFFQLLAGQPQDSVLFAAGSAVLTMLLVVRQSVELDERDRLTHRIEWEGERSEALLHHAFDAVALIGSDGRLRYASPATVRLFGDQMQGATAKGLLAIVHPDDRARLRVALANEAAPVQALRVRVRGQQDQWRTFDGHLHDHRRDPLIDGHVLHGIERTREHRFAEGIELTQPLESLGVLAGGLAHDLNNILTVVVSHGELLAGDDSLDARARADVDAIRAATDRARSLTTGLLTLSRRKDGILRPISVSEAVRARLTAEPALWRELAADGESLVRVDALAMAQVVDTVVDVAKQEARGTGVRISVVERVLDDAEALRCRVEPRVYVAISAGTGDGLGIPDLVEEAVRTETGDEWDLAPGDLALLIGLAACREAGGTLVREHRADASRLVALLPAVHQ